MIKEILAHGCIVGALIMITMAILDWFNPYMGFVENSMLIQNSLSACALLLGLAEVLGPEIEKKKKKGKEL